MKYARFVIVFAAVMAFAGVFWYVWSPFSAIARLERALLDNDRVVIRELVDFSSLRDSAVESILSQEISSSTAAISWDRRRAEVSAQMKASMNPAAWSTDIRKKMLKSYRESSYGLATSETDEARKDVLFEERRRLLQLAESGDYSEMVLTVRDGKSHCCIPLVVRGFLLYYKSPNVFVVSDGIRKRIFKRHGLFSWRYAERDII